MKRRDYLSKAQFYLQTLCNVSPNRRTGSAGNRRATAFCADAMAALGYAVDQTPFAALDYVSNGAQVRHGDTLFPVHVSPYSVGCAVTAPLVVVSSVAALEDADVAGKLLLMRGDLCAEPLMPKNFVFYNPEHHQQRIALLERKEPAGIIAATGRNPDLAGAQSPFPLFVDGDFQIPSVYCSEAVGQALAPVAGQPVHLQIDARRLPASAANVIARLNPDADCKLVVTAHIDAYEDAPGALDNAAGVVVLLLLAEMLADYEGDACVEIVAFNGEDHYSAGGQMDYLQRDGHDLNRVCLAINLDGVGFREGGTAYSFYGCPPAVEKTTDTIFQGFAGLQRGEAWYAGDHMIFVQHNRPALALTSERISELVRTVTHTAADTPDRIDERKLVNAAQALNALLRAL